MSESYMLLRPQVITTTGYNRSLLIDLGKGSYFFIPNSLAEFIRENNKKKINAIFLEYPVDDRAVVQEYLDWLLTQGLAITCASTAFINNISKVAFNWDSPFEITNCILELSTANFDYFGQIIKELAACRVPFLELRVFEHLDFELLYKALEIVQESDLKHVRLIVKYTGDLNIKKIRKAFQYFTILSSIDIFSAGLDKSFTIHDGTTAVNYRTEHLSNCSCGKFGINYFSPNMEFYSESRAYNSCLNRKVAIDANGAIKNCPSLSQSYGNIQTVSLTEVLAMKGFQDLWGLNKEKIKVCRDCEFRDICTDCRAYLQDPRDVFSKPLKCGYDPYSCEWKDWSKNPLSQKSIEYYNLQELNSSII